MQIVTTLAGANFRPAESRMALMSLDKGFNVLRLERDPTNQWDINAIKVIATAAVDPAGPVEEHFIGYVAKADNRDLATILDVIEGGEEDAAVEAGLIKPDHSPTVDRVEIFDFLSGPLKPTIVIEVSTGWELGTLVYGDGDSDGQPGFRPEEDE